MRITSKDTIAGLPILKVRDSLRHCRDHHGFFAEALTHYLDLTASEGDEVLTTLVTDGYVEPYEDRWRTTTLGNALTMAKATKPVPRAKAQAELDAFLARVVEVNASPDFLKKVVKVVLFGSFLDPDIDPVGDVDVAVAVDYKPTDGDPVELALASAKASGRRFSSFTERLFWPHNQILGFLKGRSRVISLADTDDPVLQTTAIKVIFEGIGSDNA